MYMLMFTCVHTYQRGALEELNKEVDFVFDSSCCQPFMSFIPETEFRYLDQVHQNVLLCVILIISSLDNGVVICLQYNCKS